MTGHSIERGYLLMSAVNIGKDCKIGMQSVLGPEVSLDNAVSSEPMSMVPLGTALAPMTAWEGVPVRPKKPQKKPQTRKEVDIGDRLRGKRAQDPSDNEEKGIIDDALEPQGMPLSPAAVYAVQFFGFAISIIVTCIAFMPMTLALTEFVQLTRGTATVRLLSMFIFSATYRFKS